MNLRRFAGLSKGSALSLPDVQGAAPSTLDGAVLMLT